MQSTELRKRFLDFFKARGHTLKESDALIPSGDPTVLFTSAGMNQFKDYFLGKRTDIKRAASCQMCLRTGDLDHVGRSASHHSFFEMLGNFSFGDYFKKDAIAWAWEFLTGTTDYAGTPSRDREKLCLPLPKEKLWVSIYEEDEEAAALWRALGVPAERIKRFGQAENFWPANAPTAGPNGPCGPCSEVYYDPEGKIGGPASVEVWNLVFTQFDRQPDGALKPLPKPNIDTGMGLERLTRVLQEVETNRKVETDYDTDLFNLMMHDIRAWPRGKNVKPDQVEFAERAIADHVRAIVFLLAEGLLPSNDSRGYVLRMLIRRAHRLGRSVLDLKPSSPGKSWKSTDPRSQALLVHLVPSVIAVMSGSPYEKSLNARRQVIQQAILQEEAQFVETLVSGTSKLNELIEKLRATKISVIPGEEAFKLYDTYGFPVELTVDVARDRGLTVDRAGFDAAMKTQQERSRIGSQFGGGVFVTDAMQVRSAIPALPPKEQLFVGYEQLQSDAVIKGLWDGKAWVNQARAGQSIGIVLDRSPFYGEAGGQAGDTGVIEAPKGAAKVQHTLWADDVLIHHATVEQGTLSVNDPVRAAVDAARRLKIARSHTATHLLHWALRKVLGPDAVQAGSSVEAERVRFDFSSLKPLQEEQRYDVETLVNNRVRLVDDVSTDQLSLEEAKRQGALALFGEKYGGKVRVVTIGDYSKELCGGTHVPHTGFVGALMIVGESSIAAGTRRVEALVGEAASAYEAKHRRVLYEAAKRLGRPAHDVVAGLEELLEQIKTLEHARKNLQHELAKVQAARYIAEGKKLNGVTLVTSTIKQADRELLAVLADAIRGTMGREGVVILASSNGSSEAALVMAVTSDLTSKIHAGQMLKTIAPLTQGSGGGRPEFAQAGGKDPSGIPAALQRAEELIRAALA
ncbi:MAG: alanine--tRNA ligase [Candidatus Omnitrophica bacterium]|nr:alanine--tRNA ligase [Candidatus Omnitrophota bacterium]